MENFLFDRSWIWHPAWQEDPSDETISGRFVHFRKSVEVQGPLSQPALLRLSADTKYRLYINSEFVHRGPVKGDSQLWFYDELDVSPYLREGTNHIAIEVLRLFYATRFATSFVRLPFGGLFVQSQSNTDSPTTKWLKGFDTNETWETAIDTSRFPRSDAGGDDFLHVYEKSCISQTAHLDWISAKTHQFLSAFGVTPPWKLSPRMIPTFHSEWVSIRGIHNVKSSSPVDVWSRLLMDGGESIQLDPGTTHYFEIEMNEHMTADLFFHFQRPREGGASIEVTYAECYEDEPNSPYNRAKGNRRDTTKGIYGPTDNYILQGQAESLGHHTNEKDIEIFSPFHFRTFMVMAVKIVTPASSHLTFSGIKIKKTHYPLDVTASFTARSQERKLDLESSLWNVSLRTLQNCLHDCYEDCPFYEQLQYAMDTRSCVLFTYLVSGDDRLARQAIHQLHNSFQPALGLTASRAPCAQTQIIPNFSLFWVLMVVDHFEYFADAAFTKKFLPVVNAVLDSFDRRIDDEYQLVHCYDNSAGVWDFVDWTDSWKPFGEVPAAKRTGFQTVASALYAHSLSQVAGVLGALGLEDKANDLKQRKDKINAALRRHCFDGAFFTDGLASMKDPENDYSVHSQIWAVLCGATSGSEAVKMLQTSLDSSTTISKDGNEGPVAKSFSEPSIAMSFYTLRALSALDRNLYNTHYHSFWLPWKSQLDQNLTTWVEDQINQRSDCHAWGSSPLYEFSAEVTGVKPGAPGWEVIEFAPRVELYDSIDARVVVGGSKYSAVAHVSWKRDGRDTTVSFEIEPIPSAANSVVPKDIKVRTTLPDGTQQTTTGSSKLSFVMQSDPVSG